MQERKLNIFMSFGGLILKGKKEQSFFKNGIFSTEPLSTVFTMSTHFFLNQSKDCFENDREIFIWCSLLQYLDTSKEMNV